MNPAALLFCFQMEEPSSAISYSIWVEVTGKKTADPMALASPPQEQYVLGVKVAGFYLHESTELTTILSKHPPSLLHPSKKAKKIKGVSPLLKEGVL